MRAAEPLVSERCRLGEGCLWRDADQRVYWVDIGPPSRILSCREDGSSLRTWLAPEMATSLTRGTEQPLIVTLRTGIRAFDPDSGRWGPHILLLDPDESMRLNDCGCDPWGRFWTASMRDNVSLSMADAEERQVGHPVLIRIDPDHSISKFDSPAECPNTFVWSMDCRSLYFADSAARTIMKIAYQGLTGELGTRTEFARLDTDDLPDGSALDANGCLWNARWNGSRVICLSPQGSIVDEIRLPCRRVTSCAFGGSDFRTLFITTAIDLDPYQGADDTRSGGQLFAARLPVRGHPVHAFGGM